VVVLSVLARSGGDDVPSRRRDVVGSGGDGVDAAVVTVSVNVHSDGSRPPLPPPSVDLSVLAVDVIIAVYTNKKSHSTVDETAPHAT